jgi:hypothetical protein
MSTSHDGRILDHLAGYMLYFSTAPSFRFSLNSSHGHGFHLSKRFGMIPHNYECIMIAANLAERHRKFGFTIKLTLLNVFLNGHRFRTSNSTIPFEVARGGGAMRGGGGGVTSGDATTSRTRGGSGGGGDSGSFILFCC